MHCNVNKHRRGCIPLHIHHNDEFFARHRNSLYYRPAKKLYFAYKFPCPTQLRPRGSKPVHVSLPVIACIPDQQQTKWGCYVQLETSKNHIFCQVCPNTSIVAQPHNTVLTLQWVVPELCCLSCQCKIRMFVFLFFYLFLLSREPQVSTTHELDRKHLSFTHRRFCIQVRYFLFTLRFLKSILHCCWLVCKYQTHHIRHGCSYYTVVFETMSL